MLETPVDPLAAARARLYALFAEALNYPEGAVAFRLLDGDWFGEACEICALLPHHLGFLDPDSPPQEAGGIEALQRHYSTLFDVGSGRPKVSLLERRYVDTPEQKLWTEILAFYTHFGLDFSSGSAVEQPDHLLTELSFMHYLCFLEAAATAGIEDLQRGQRDFLEHHLCRLTVGLQNATGKLDNGDVYVQLLEAVVSFVAADLDFRSAAET